MTTTFTNNVTSAQVSLCSRLIDETKNEIYYQVESQTEAGTYYEVRAITVNGQGYMTCTCKAGQSGTPCWHKRAAVAHSMEYKAMQQQQARRLEVVAFVEGTVASHYTVQDASGKEQSVSCTHAHKLYICSCCTGDDLSDNCQHTQAVESFMAQLHSELAEHARYVASNR